MSAVLKAREPSARYPAGVRPTLVEHFDLVASAPGGVARLRELILTLAVRGNLVPQDKSDEPASLLLEQIRAEKNSLMASGKIRRESPAALIRADDVPHRVPAGWQWATLGTVTKKITDGTHHSPANFPQGDFKYLSAKNIKSWGVDLTDVTYVPASIHQEIYSRCDPEFGDILYIKDGATTGVLTINTLKEQFSLLSSVGVIKPSCGLTSEYLALVLRSPFFYQAMRDGMTGVAITRVTLSKLAAALFPLPPLAEQSRIVARVDELMRLCDELEQKGRFEVAQHTQLLDALLSTLTGSTSPEELAANWQRVATHFDLLLDRPEAVDVFEKTLVQLAVRGALVSQDANDEPATTLVEKICVTKRGLVHHGKIKSGQQMPPVSESEQEFPLPRGWTWARWNVVALQIGDIDHKMPQEVIDGVPYVSPRDFRGINEIDFEGAKKISLADFALLAKKIQPARGDLIYPRYGTIGDVRLVTDDRNFLASYSCAVIKVMPGLMNPQFQYLVAISDHIRKQAGLATNTTTQPNVGLKSIQQYVVPVPPLCEQHRIVARVNELRRLCADLREKLAKRQTTQARLADTLVESAVSAG
jgi:type I restriction enzyme, S subunit